MSEAANAAPRIADAIRVELPSDGCWVAASCELRIRAASPLRLSPQAPTVRSSATLEVLSVESEPAFGAPTSAAAWSTAAPDAWIVRVIAFEPGDLALPAMRIDVLDAARQRTTIDAPSRTIVVRDRALTGSSPLADLEALAPSATLILLWSIVFLSAIFLATATISVALRRRRRIAAWLDALLAAARARRRAVKLLRRSSADTEIPRIYDRIVEALRVALTPRFGASVVAMTSAEVLAQAARSQMAEADRQTLAALLTTSDIVRFGGHVPSPDQASADLARARLVIQSKR